MSYSIIQKSQLEGAHRLDAEYYQPDYLKAMQLILNQKFSTLGELCKLFDGPFGSDILADEYVDSGIPVLRMQDIKAEGILDIENPEFLPAKSEENYKKFLIFPGDIAITKVGFLGYATVIERKFPKYFFRREITRAVMKDRIINHYYLTTFLNSKYGRFQSDRLSSGTSRDRVLLINQREIVIPLFNKSFQEEVGELALKAYSQFEDSKMIYKQAENLLLEELGLKDFQITDDLFFVLNASNAKVANRIDADYFQPKYKNIESRIMNYEYKKLGDLVSIKKGFEPGSEAYQEEGKLFIRVSSVSKYGIEDKDQKYLSDDLYQKLKKNFEPKIGEILLTKDGSPGISYVLKENIEGIISGGIMRLKVNDDVDPEYLSLCISSLIGQMQAVRDAGGSIISHWKPDQIKNIFIPVLPKEVQQKIADLVRKSHEARKKSKELLEEAKRKVEEMIENAN